MKPGKGQRKESVRHDGAWWFSPPWPTREAPGAPSDVPWCTRGRVSLADDHERLVRWRRGGMGFGKVRCPKCGRVLQIETVDIENGRGVFRPYLPPHKRKALETIKAKKHAARKARNRKRARRAGGRGR